MSKPKITDESDTGETLKLNTTALDLIGRTLENRYEIEELIGEGAMGYVYKGRQLRLRRPVAIKIPRTELANDIEYMARFEREALTMARCIHENIVTIYDVYVARNPGELSYLVMELVSGVNLHRFLKTEEENLTVKAVLEILRHLARGIDAAHAAGVIHRDIKPSNMIVTLPQRVAKIMDFGIAKADLENIFRTQTGRAMGTPAFMAPEQIKGQPVGPYTDIYSFGMSIYKMFARRLPFDSSTTPGLLVAHVNKKPLPLRRRNPAWPTELEEAIAKSITKNPDIRPPSASRFVDEIEEALRPYFDHPFAKFFPPELITAPDSMPEEEGMARKKKRTWIAAIAVIVLLAVAGIVFMNKIKKAEGDVNLAGPPGGFQEPSGLETDPKPGPGEKDPAKGSIPIPSPASDSQEEAGLEEMETASPPAGSPSLEQEEQQPTPDITPLPAVEVKPAATTSPKPTSEPPALETSSPEVEVPTVEPSEMPELTEPETSVPPEEPYIWGPEITGRDRILQLKLIDRIIVEGIRRPLFRGQVERAKDAFFDVDASKRKSFFDLIDKYRTTHKDLTLIYIRLSERIDEERAEILFRTGLSGIPLYSPNGRKQEDLIPAFEDTAVFEKRDGDWFMVDWPSFIENN